MKFSNIPHFSEIIHQLVQLQLKLLRQRRKLCTRISASLAFNGFSYSVKQVQDSSGAQVFFVLQFLPASRKQEVNASADDKQPLAREGRCGATDCILCFPPGGTSTVINSA